MCTREMNIILKPYKKKSDFSFTIYATNKVWIFHLHYTEIAKSS